MNSWDKVNELFVLMVKLHSFETVLTEYNPPTDRVLSATAV